VNPPGVTLKVGSFGLEDSASPLDRFWAANLEAALSNLENRRFTLVSGQAQSDYLIIGNTLRVGNSVRVYSRLIKQTDASIQATWTTDFELTEFLQTLLFVEESSSNTGVLRDPYETDSLERPVTVEIGGALLNRTIHNADDRDWFLLVADHKGLIVAETKSDLDTMMELYDEGGTRIASNDDGGEGTNARISIFADPGKRYIAMVKPYSSETGTYQFQAVYAEIPDEDLEPNDTPAEATLLTLGTPVLAYVGGGDIDWYQIQVPAGGSLLSIYTEGELDTILTLYTADEEEITSDDDSGNGSNARITRNLETGRFYVKVSLYDSDASGGNYTLHAQVRDPVVPDYYEPDNSINSAKVIEIGVPQTRNFTTGDDEDWVELRITQNGRYTIRAQGETSNNLDTYLELYDDEEELIAEDDDSGESYDALISTRLVPGIYYIKVSCLDSDPQDKYILSVESR
jgi:hypothetical protein